MRKTRPRPEKKENNGVTPRKGKNAMKLLVLDGNSILNRAFFGIKLLTTKAGDYTNGIYGFLTMLNKLLEETAPDGVAIAFDQKESPWMALMSMSWRGATP